MQHEIHDTWGRGGEGVGVLWGLEDIHERVGEGLLCIQGDMSYQSQQQGQSGFVVCFSMRSISTNRSFLHSLTHLLSYYRYSGCHPGSLYYAKHLQVHSTYQTSFLIHSIFFCPTSRTKPRKLRPRRQRLKSKIKDDNLNFS